MNPPKTTTPPDWRVRALAELGAQVTSGSRGWAAYYADHGSLFVRIANLDRSTIYLDLRSPRFVHVNPDDAEARRTRLVNGDLLISITADIGIIGYIDERVPKPAYMNQHIARVRLDPRLADSCFVAYYLASWEPQRRFVGSTDTGAKAGMNLTTVAALPTVVPPLAEQSRIAEALADVDESIVMLERMIAKKRAIKQGMMQQLLSGRTRLPGFTNAWREMALGDVATVDPEALSSETDPETSIDYISLENVDRGKLLGYTQIRFGSAPSRARRVLRCSDVLFGTVRPNLQSHTLYQGGLNRPIASTGFSIVRAVVDRSCPRFLFQLLMSHLTVAQVDRITAGSSYPAISSSDVRRLTFEVPPIAEQQVIGTILADGDAELCRIKARLARAREVKQGMMQELLTGRTRLPVEEGVP